MTPLGKTAFGVTVWPVLPGRGAGQRTRLAHLTWGGPGDAIHLHAGGASDGRREYYGTGTGTVSGPCRTAAEAQQAADAYLAGLGAAAATASTRGTAAAASPASAQPRAASEATAPLPATGPGDETSRVLAEYGTPEKQLDYALLEAARRRSDANAAAREQHGADASAPWAALWAGLRYHVASAAARARWAAEAEAAVTWYAGVIGAAAPAAGPASAGSDSPYALGQSLELGINRRPDGYADWQWREYVAGFADGARLRTHDAAARAEKALEQAQELGAQLAARAVAAAIRTAGRSPEAAGITVSEGPGHPLVYDLRIPAAIASALSLGAGANDLAEEQIGRVIDVAGCVTILSAETGGDFAAVTIRLGSGGPEALNWPAAAPAEANAGLAAAPGRDATRPRAAAPDHTRGRGRS